MAEIFTFSFKCMSKLIQKLFMFFMLHTLKNVRDTIGLGSTVRPFVHTILVKKWTKKN